MENQIEAAVTEFAELCKFAEFQTFRDDLRRILTKRFAGLAAAQVRADTNFKTAAQDENAELQATIGKAAGSLRNKLDAALANYPAAKEESLESIIVGMIERGCIHRNGKALNAVDDREIMRHMREEVGELDQACDIGPENILEESADVLGTLIHLVRHYGFTMAQVEQQEIKKLKERFTEPAHPPAALAREGTKS